MRSKKEIEFLEFKLGDLIIVEYAAKFEELMKFCLHYNNIVAEGSKCIKFESMLRRESMMRKTKSDLLTTIMLVKRKARDIFEESRM